MYLENKMLHRRLTQIKRQVEVEQISTRNNNVMISGLKVKSETGEKGVENLMREIRAQVRRKRLRE